MAEIRSGIIEAMDDFSFRVNPEDRGEDLRTKVIDFIQTVVVFAAIASIVYLLIAQPHRVSGNSMLPTLYSGDFIITDKVSYRFRAPQRGETIVFKNPRKETEDFIKRIIGLPGDRIKLEGNRVIINGLAIEEKYLRPTVITSSNVFLKEGEETLIPGNHYVVMGDNRSQSSDSREWGFIVKEEIIGKAFFRYYPFGHIGLIN